MKIFGSFYRHLKIGAIFLSISTCQFELAAQDASGSSISATLRTAAVESIRAADLVHHIGILASDEFEGRAPASLGEQKSVDYLIEQFKRFGLKPGNPDGSYVQKVPMMGILSESSIAYRTGDKKIEHAYPGESVVWSRRYFNEVTVTNSEVVFVGYGIVAPEYGWDDYKGVDVRGKTIVMLINDPPIPDPLDPNRLDESYFKGNAMTYYGRWTYKYEIATEKGAAAAIIIHETGPAGYPYYVLVASNARENFDLQSTDKNVNRVAVEGWMQFEKAKELFAASGFDLESEKKRALSRNFRPLPLKAKADFIVRNRLRETYSTNVVSLLEGSDPKLSQEYVVYTAHWDHLGRNPKLEGDQIFNGALDNATGTAGLLELAEAFSKLEQKPKRSVLFLGVTAEENGLLGAKYYAENPLYPLAGTLANINMDGINPWGRTKDVEVIGFGNSTLEDLLSEAAQGQGRTIRRDSEPEKGRFYRSDHFEFAKKGVPGLYIKAGTDFVGKPAEFGKEKVNEYTLKDYHKVTDEMKSDWNLEGGAEDLKLLFQVGYSVLQGTRYPEWKPGSEFKKRREEMLQRSRGN